MNAIEAAWDRIEAALAECACAGLRGPASEADLAALEEAWGELPAAVAATLARHDGCEGPLLGFSFPPARELVGLYDALCEDPEWDDTWLPLGSDGAGNYLLLDFNTHEVFEHDHEEGPAELCDGLEELLRWAADALERDRPRPDPDGDLVTAAGRPWKAHPAVDQPAGPEIGAWRAAAEGLREDADGDAEEELEPDPSVFARFQELFHCPPGPGFDRVRAPGEPTRKDWDRLLAWALRAGDVAAQIDATHGAVQAGRFSPDAESVEANLAQHPDHPIYVHLRGLLHFFEGRYEEAIADMDALLAQADALAPRCVRGLAAAALERGEAARADLSRALARGDWLGGQDVVRERLAELG